ncbi:unnamed protein product [Staurois parvus]|uniref:Uncharacterized protein n=1 Tax=Staurois parvus TaxID=386267 RepID=A0ABN9ET24_9NEOB|nr:unnamed protein product [Staurois parvus]
MVLAMGRYSDLSSVRSTQPGRTDHLETWALLEGMGSVGGDAPGTFFIDFFELGQGHRGPMIPYCPGAP